MLTIEERNFYRRKRLQHKWLREDLKISSQYAMLITFAIVAIITVLDIIRFICF